MIICLNLMYYFYSSRPTPNFSRGKKLLHVFWNTLYVMTHRCADVVYRSDLLLSSVFYTSFHLYFVLLNTSMA